MPLYYCLKRVNLAIKIICRKILFTNHQTIYTNRWSNLMTINSVNKIFQISLLLAWAPFKCPWVIGSNFFSKDISVWCRLIYTVFTEFLKNNV